MLGGNVMIGYREQIAVTEYFDGAARSDVVADVFLARANHSELGVVENATESSAGAMSGW